MISFTKLKQIGSLFTIQTVGLITIGRSEMSATIHDPHLEDEAKEFLNYVSRYLITSHKSIHSGETMAYGYWLVNFKRAHDNVLEAWEYKPDASDFERGVDLTLSYWRDQNDMCKKYASQFMPPRPDKLIVISEGVLEGLPPQGVRYPSPDHMSGWWITTDLYNGNINTLRHEHAYHVTAARPELAKFLALDYGFRFDLSSTEDVWLDEKVLDSKA